MMTWYSYLYMFSVWAIITGLTIYCFYRVLTSKKVITHDDKDNDL
ncbi:MAG TPA: hypothetical protein PLX23_05175 [Candidatus Hydrogenedens sp.]|nr:hypothetical protein [Candidatus Hydrogenedens sp.]